MKRAEVYRDEVWRVHVRDGVIHDRHLAIKDRWVPSGDADAPFPTHAAALAHALAEVGLTKKNTEKETPMEHDDQQCSNPETLCDDCLYYGAQENR